MKNPPSSGPTTVVTPEHRTECALVVANVRAAESPRADDGHAVTVMAPPPALDGAGGHQPGHRLRQRAQNRAASERRHRGLQYGLAPEGVAELAHDSGDDRRRASR